ncbi:DUF2933 domain-containing protein [Natroniella sulfidigena]|uniref:DUF2933 domain-containing protein n=1 Tax=Natroniella sulfidigena TaxID=723921 RepID=UPI00200A2C39|nr:DUF2933 domain-containing protein [Natroniella sulfidigena]MCK8816829.1 DUF2933 domain-containing protein [Natroniella sulfidigena]
MSKKGHQHGGNHMWMMLLCCLAMFAGIWWFAGGTGLEVGRDTLAGGNFRWLIFLLCPLMHLFMMKGMCHKDKGDEEEEDCH